MPDDFDAPIDEEQGEVPEPEDLHPSRPRHEAEHPVHWLGPFGTTLTHTESWLREVGGQLGTDNPRDAWHALHAVLSTLRDQLPVEEVADLCAELPFPIRGLLVDGWAPHRRRVRTRAALLDRIEERIATGRVAPDRALHAVMHVLGQHISAGQLAHVRGLLPTELKEIVEVG